MNHAILDTEPPASAASTASTNPPVTPAPTPRRQPSYTIYKPNKRGDGGAVSFNLNRTKGAVFVEASNQSGEKQFDWENKIIMKWGLPDLGNILAGLRGRQPQTKLFHQTEKANSACSLTANEDPDRAPFLLTLSRQDAEDKTVRKVTISLSQSEAAVLETAMHTAINRLLDW